MSEIKRYDLETIRGAEYEDQQEMVESLYGKYVLSSDHEADLAAKDAEIDQLEQQLREANDEITSRGVELERLKGELKAEKALAAERQRCRKEEVEPLMEAAEDALACADAEWQAVNKHPGSSHRKDVRYYSEIIAAVRAVQEEKP